MSEKTLDKEIEFSRLKENSQPPSNELLDLLQISRNQNDILTKKQLLLQAQIIELDHALRLANDKIEQDSSELIEAKRRIQELEYMIEHYMESQKNLENEVSTLQEDFHIMQDKNDRLEKENLSLNTELDHEKMINNNLQSAFEAQEEEFRGEKEKIKMDSHELFSSLQEMTAERNQLRGERKKLIEEIESMGDMIGELRRGLSRGEEREQSLLEESVELRKEREEWKLKVERGERAEEERRGEIERLEGEIERWRKRVEGVVKQEAKRREGVYQKVLGERDELFSRLKAQGEVWRVRVESTESQLAVLEREREKERRDKEIAEAEFRSLRENSLRREEREKEREREMHHKITQLLENYNEKAEEAQQLSRSLTSVREALNSDVEKLREKNEATERRCLKLEDDNKGKKESCEDLQLELSNARRLMMECEAEMERMRSEWREREGRMKNEYEGRIEGLEKRLSEVSGMSDEKEKSLSSAIHIERRKREGELEEWKSRVTILEREVDRQKKTSDSAKSQLCRVLAAISRSNNDILASQSKNCTTISL